MRQHYVRALVDAAVEERGKRRIMPEYNARGNLVDVTGKTGKTPTHLLNIGTDDVEHQAMLRFFEPSFEETLREVMAEVFEMRMSGTLRPFVEGEPIGALPRVVKKRLLTPEQMRRSHNETMRWRREATLELRRKNDATIRRLLAP